jgi:hypothetical protein
MATAIAMLTVDDFATLLMSIEIRTRGAANYWVAQRSCWLQRRSSSSCVGSNRPQRFVSAGECGRLSAEAEVLKQRHALHIARARAVRTWAAACAVAAADRSEAGLSRLELRSHRHCNRRASARHKAAATCGGLTVGTAHATLEVSQSRLEFGSGAVVMRYEPRR